VAHACNLATWEAEIRRIVVQSQSRLGVNKNSSQPIARHTRLSFQSKQEAEIGRIAVSGQPRNHLNGGKNLGVVACTCDPSCSRKCKIGGAGSRPAQAKSETLSPK
jgi:hypothetical protein